MDRDISGLIRNNRTLGPLPGPWAWLVGWPYLSYTTGNDVRECLGSSGLDTYAVCVCVAIYGFPSGKIGRKLFDHVVPSADPISGCMGMGRQRFSWSPAASEYNAQMASISPA